MKKIITLSFISLFSFQLHAQIFIEGIELDSIYAGTYISVTWENKAFIKFGQNKTEHKDLSKLTDKNGTPIEFNSSISLLNYFDNNNWELADISNENRFNLYEIKRYYFKRKND